MKKNQQKYIMVHHLHDNKSFTKIKGSISLFKFNIIVKKFHKKKYIFTFDDGYKSQIVLASKILNKFDLTGIFFLNTFFLDNKINLHELSKFFIEKYFKTYDQFLNNFLKLYEEKLQFNKKKIDKLKKKFPFYSDGEIKIRFLRNNNIEVYNKILIQMFMIKKFEYKKFAKKLFPDRDDILKLSRKHIIGLHTHTHPYNFNELNYKQQMTEIKTNKKILEKIIKKKVNFFSYPIGNYNKFSFKVIKDLKIQKAFINSEKSKKIRNKFLIPRLNINNVRYANKS